MEIIRGTTPTIIFTFNEIDAADISVCYLLIKQNGNTIIEKTLSDATVSDDLSFTLTQSDTLKLCKEISAQICLDWKTNGGVRGRSRMYDCGVKEAGVNNVI